MKHTRWWLPVALALALSATGPVGRSSADETLDQNASTTATSPDELDRWWGVAGAVVCGAEMRLVRVAPELGMNPYALAAGIAGCLLAALDATT